MGQFNFVYAGMNDKFEHGKILEMQIGSTDADDGITVDEVLECFSDFLRGIGYVFDSIEVVNKDTDHD